MIKKYLLEKYLHGQDQEQQDRHRAFYVEFDRLFKLYAQKGLTQRDLANVSGVDPAVVSRTLTEDEHKRTVPSRPNLIKLCTVLFQHGVIRSPEEGDNLFHLCGHATPSETHKALTQTTEQHAVVKPTPKVVTTDELRPLPEWAQPVINAQFKRIASMSFEEK